MTLNKKYKLILGYFLSLEDIYEYSFSSYDIQVYGDDYIKTKSFHDKIIGNILFKNKAIQSIIDFLRENGYLYLKEGGYSKSGNIHYPDQLLVKESIKESINISSLKEEIIKRIYSFLEKFTKNINNLIILKLIDDNVPFDVLKKVFQKDISEVIRYGLTDGNSLIKFSEKTKLAKIFNYNLRDKVSLNQLLDKKKKKLFTSLSKEEKLVLSVLNFNETISSRGMKNFPNVTNKTMQKYESYYDRIHTNLNDKLIISSLILEKEIYQIEEVFENLRVKGKIWEEEVTVYSVVYKKIIKILPIVDKNYLENKKPNIKNEILNIIDIFIKNNKVMGLFFLDTLVNSISDSNSLMIPRERTDFLMEGIGDQFPFELKFIYAFYQDDIYVSPFYLKIISEKLIQMKITLTNNYWDRILNEIKQNFKYNPGVNVSHNEDLGRKWINIQTSELMVKLLILPYITFNDLKLIQELLERCNYLIILISHQKYPIYKRCLEYALSEEKIDKIHSIFLIENRFQTFPEKELPLNLMNIIQIDTLISSGTYNDEDIFDMQRYCKFCGGKMSASDLQCPHCDVKVEK